MSLHPDEKIQNVKILTAPKLLVDPKWHAAFMWIHSGFLHGQLDMTLYRWSNVCISSLAVAEYDNHTSFHKQQIYLDEVGFVFVLNGKECTVLFLTVIEGTLPGFGEAVFLLSFRVVPEHPGEEAVTVTPVVNMLLGAKVSFTCGWVEMDINS